MHFLQYSLTLILMPLLIAAGADLQAAESVLIRDVPHITQKPDFCGEACVAMALQRIQKLADQDFVFDQAGLSPLQGRGCYTKELASACRNIGFDIGPVWHKVNPASATAELGKLFQIIHTDLMAGQTPVVCMHYDQRPDTTEHFRLIVGYDAAADEIVYHEPANGAGAYQRMPRRTFLKLWPLKYEADRWTVVLLRLRPAGNMRGEISADFTDADYSQHIQALKARLPAEHFRIVLQKPFVVIGDESLETVRQRSTQTVKWAVSRLKKDYFTRDPHHIIDIWLFRDENSYERNTIKLFGSSPNTPYGYYSSTDKALVMNISTGGGTLVHEIVHPFVESNFEKCPAWFNEGFASLYEQSRDKGGHIWGSTNWRLKGLQAAIAAGKVPPFKTLCSTTTREFYNADPGTNYSQARYLCYYLQERELLVKYYHAFRRNAKSDPTGYKTLRSVLGVQDMDAFQQRWESHTADLRF